MRASRVVFRLGVAALLSAAAWANDVALTDDAFFANGTPATSARHLPLNVGGPSAFQSLFQSSLSTLPIGTTAALVSKASLRLFVYRIGTPGFVDVILANGAGTESTVTGSGGSPLRELWLPSRFPLTSGAFIC